MGFSGAIVMAVLEENLAQKTLLVIPVYNHGDTLRRVVESAIKAGWPVLVVDDGSTDGGVDRLADLDCQIIQHAKNQGKGTAMLSGAKWALEQGYDAMVTVDADGQLDPSEAHLLVEKAKENWPALVIGNREMDPEKTPGASRFGRSFSNFWVRMETGLELPDTQSGFRLYPLVQLLEQTFRCTRYDFEIESLVRLAWSGVTILSAPISVYYPPAEERQSHFHQFKDNFRLTRLHTRLVLRALSPLPHKGRKKQEKEKFDVSVLHPIRLLKTLCLEHSTTFQLAVAVWMGIFLGALPLLAAHTVTIIYVAHKLHLNKLAAVAASQFCMPPVVPVLCIQAGYFMRKGEFLWEISWDIAVVQLHERLWEWLLGSLILGPLLGFVGAVISYFTIKGLRNSRFANSSSIGQG